MKLFASADLRLLAFYLILVLVCCSPIWGVQYFINQDGSPHLYNGYLMTELLKDNPFVSQHLALNPIPLPNSSGHWLIVAFLSILPPMIVTKVIVTLTFAGFVAAIGWLRYRTVGRDALKTSLLIGAVLAFNWMWLLGFYNFIIGVIGFIFTTGLYYGWRERMGLGRAAVLSLCILFVYLSHIVAFAALGASLGVLVLFSQRDQLKRNILWLAAACLPVIPLVVMYKLTSGSAGGFSPNWRSLADPLSLSNWITQVLAADAFILMSRRTLPFSAIQSSSLAVLAPSLWAFIGFLFLAAATLYKRSRTFLVQRQNLPFVILSGLFLAASLFMPDDFGLANGALLRPRLLLCGLCFVVPLFRTDTSVFLKRAAQLCLIFVVIFQTFALWEFARRSDTVAREFLAAGAGIEEGESIASVIMVGDDGRRFQALPETQADTLLGLGRDIFIWDNYELGYYLFPIMIKERADREFIYDLSTSHGFIPNDPGDAAQFDERLAVLASSLRDNHAKIDKLLVWGTDARVETVLKEWFSSDPIFHQGRVRVYRHN